jgi:L-serine dehydratase
MYLSFDMLKLRWAFELAHLGPWELQSGFLANCEAKIYFLKSSAKIDLYGSPSLTGKGHATDLAVMLGLSDRIQNTFQWKILMR